METDARFNMELIYLLNRISISGQANESMDRLARIINVAGAGLLFDMIGRRATPNPIQVSKMIGLRRALDSLGDKVKQENRLSFFEQKRSLLGDRRLADLLGTDEEQKVLDFISGIADGSFS